jgi:hypothetical protein
MAKFKTGIISNISGSTGGTSFSSSRYGNVMRLKPQPINTWSEIKQNAISKNVNVARLWAKCTPAQVEAWTEFAKDFKRIDRSKTEVACRPVDIFRKINRNRWEVNEPFIFNPPKKIYPNQFTSIDFEIIASDKIDDLKVYFKPKIEKGTKIMVFVSRMLKYGENSSKKSFYKKIGWIDSNFKSGDSILDKYLSVYKLNTRNTFKLAFKFKPVSIISGLSLDPISFIRIPQSLNDSLLTIQQAQAILFQHLTPTINSKPETQNPELKIQTPEPQASSPQPPASNSEPETQNPEL